jgi:hypothetical protein
MRIVPELDHKIRREIRDARARDPLMSVVDLQEQLEERFNRTFTRKYIAKLAFKVERQALQEADRTKPNQVACYIKGVGTASWAPFAALDGATGIGVPSNVRKLCRFLCWNWEPGDEIYIFGFGRGAFTARTLAGLISSQGLVPAEIDGLPVSHTEVPRNAMAASRAYRRRTVPWHKSLPTIWLARMIRDWMSHTKQVTG